MTQRARRRRRRLHESGRKKLLLGLGIPLALAGIATAVGLAWVISVYNSAPSLASLEPITKGAVSKVYAADGSLIGVIHSDKIRQPVGSPRIPEDLKNATVAIEDRRFYSHGGVDPSAIIRAGWEDL